MASVQQTAAKRQKTSAPDFSCTNFGQHANFINGLEVPAISGETSVTTAAANNTQIGTVAKSAPEDVDAAIAAAAVSQKGWWARPVGDRERILLQCADAIEKNAADLARVLMWDSASVKGKAMMETMYSASLFRTAAGEARRLYGALLLPQLLPSAALSVTVRCCSPNCCPQLLCL